MVRISGFGQDGPYSQRAGYGVIGEAVSGLRHLTGDPDRPPARVAVSMTDYITGLYAAFGATLALLARGKSGRGQCIDAALYECAFSFMEPWIPAFEKLGHVAKRCGSRLPESTPNNLYATGDGNFIHITAMGDAVFQRLADRHGPARPGRRSALSRGDGALGQPRGPRRHHRPLDGEPAAGRSSSDPGRRPACRRRASSPSPTSSTIRTTRRATPSCARRTPTSAPWPWPASCRACRRRPAACATPVTTSATTRAACCAELLGMRAERDRRAAGAGRDRLRFAAAATPRRRSATMRTPTNSALPEAPPADPVEERRERLEAEFAASRSGRHSAWADPEKLARREAANAAERARAHRPAVRRRHLRRIRPVRHFRESRRPRQVAGRRQDHRLRQDRRPRGRRRLQRLHGAWAPRAAPPTGRRSRTCGASPPSAACRCVFLGESSGARMPDHMGSRGMGALLGNDGAQYQRLRETPWASATLGPSYGSSSWYAVLLRLQRDAQGRDAGGLERRCSPRSRSARKSIPRNSAAGACTPR